MSMTRRNFVKMAGVIGLAGISGAVIGCGENKKAESADKKKLRRKQNQKFISQKILMPII